MTENAQPNDAVLNGVLIGFGNVAVNAHLPLLNNRRFRIKAVVEPSVERASLARNLLPGVRVHADLDSLLSENDIDFADICTPPCYHAEQTLAACRAGLHVICEKPLVTRLDDLNRMEQAAREHDRVIFTVNNWKHAPIWAKAMELIHEKRLGTIRSVSLNVLRPPNSGGGAFDWRRCAKIAGGGILLDHGWHHVYLILAMMNGAPSTVQAKMNFIRSNGSSYEDTVDLTLGFEQAEARVHLTWCASCRENRGRIEGDEGLLLINDDHLIMETNHGSPPTTFRFPEALSQGSHHPEWMRPVVENFRREIFDPSAKGGNLAEARWCARIIEAAYRSHREDSCPIPLNVERGEVNMKPNPDDL